MEKHKFILYYKDPFKRAKDKYVVKIANGVQERGAFTVGRHKPYFSLLNESGTVKNFIQALVNEKSNADTAPDVYVSKSAQNSMDFDELASWFKNGSKINYSLNYYFERYPVSGYVSMVTLVNNGGGRSQTDIIHIKMICEPDRFGKWKIYKIEREG